MLFYTLSDWDLKPAPCPLSYFLDKVSNSLHFHSHLNFYLSWQPCSCPDPCLLWLHALPKGQLDPHCNAVRYHPRLHLRERKEIEQRPKKTKEHLGHLENGTLPPSLHE